MISLRLTIDASGVLETLYALKAELINEQTTGKFLQSQAEIIASNVRGRLNFSPYGGSRSRYREGMDRDDAGYEKARYEKFTSSDIQGTIGTKGATSQLIENRIRTSMPFSTNKGLGVGIGEYKVLEEIKVRGVDQEGGTKGEGAPLWWLLEFGTGTFSTAPDAPGKPIIRTKGQVFLDRQNKDPFFWSYISTGFGNEGDTFDMDGHDVTVVGPVTKNPGHEGRHFFLKWDMGFYASDMIIKENIYQYLGGVFKKYSYK